MERDSQIVVFDKDYYKKVAIQSRIAKIILLCSILLLGYIIYDLVKIYNPEPVYNFVELQFRFKNYTVANKLIEDNSFVFYLINPVTKEEYKVKVTEAMYYNIYFVGDIIK